MTIGIVDSSGIEFFYTSQPREQEAGILNLGHVVNRFMVVPPRANNFTIIGKCGGECTSQVSCLITTSLFIINYGSFLVWRAVARPPLISRLPDLCM